MPDDPVHSHATSHPDLLEAARTLEGPARSPSKPGCVAASVGTNLKGMATVASSGTCAFAGCTERLPERPPGKVGRSQIYCSHEHAHAAQRLRAAARQPGYRKRTAIPCPVCRQLIGRYNKSGKCIRCHPRGKALPNEAASPAGERLLELCRVRGVTERQASRQAGFATGEFSKIVSMKDRHVTAASLDKLVRWDGQLSKARWLELVGGQTDGQARLAKIERRDPGHHRRMSAAGREATLRNIESELQAEGATETGTALRRRALFKSASRAAKAPAPSRSRHSKEVQAARERRLGTRAYRELMAKLRQQAEVPRALAVLRERDRRDQGDQEAKDLLELLETAQRDGKRLEPYLREEENRRVLDRSLSLLAGPRGAATHEAVKRRALGHMWHSRKWQVATLRNYLLEPRRPGPQKDRQSIPRRYRSADGIFAIAAVVVYLKEEKWWTLIEIGAALGWHVHRSECHLASCFYELAQDLAKSSTWQSDWTEAYAAAKLNTKNLNLNRTLRISE
jgi:hypothetical protein